MSLFDQIERMETRVRRQNEGTFDYLNFSARPGICAIRNLLEAWFEHVPLNAQPDIRGRLRSGDEVGYESAFFELFWHELLRSTGYEVDIHPGLNDADTSPDFLAKRNDDPKFYLEATLAMPPGDPAEERRIAELHDTLDRMDSPDFFVEFQYRGSPQENIRGRVLRERLERWLRQLDFQEISRLYGDGDYQNVPTWTCVEQGVILTFTPIPKGPEHRGRPGVRPIGVVMPIGFRQITTHDDIRAAVEGKASKYGQLGLPLVIAVNVIDDFYREEDRLDALFGEAHMVAVREVNGVVGEREARSPNGAWIGRPGPRNTLVSAAVVTHRLSPSTLAQKTVELIHNPWAAHPLNPEYLPFPHCVISRPGGTIHRREGTQAKELLRIPEVWPVPD